VRAVVVTVAAAVLVLLAACSGDGEAPADEAQTVRFTRAGHEAMLSVEIADEPAERSRGLSNRESLGEDAGMLFVYEEDTGTGFWMKDTTIPLSIAFVSAAGVVIDLQDMEPLSEEVHRSPDPYRYAVEANQGWFEDNEVRAGDIVQLPVGVGG
jgi:uncharacterized membrane protein (UPF0127 family)